MRKVLIVVLVIIILVVAIGLFLVRSHGAKVLANYLSELMGVPVTVEHMDISFNKLSIINLEIQNPRAGSVKDAFQAPRIDIGYEFTSLFKKTRHVTEFYMDSPTIFVELYNLTGSKNNWATIVKSINNNGSSGDDHDVQIDSLLIEPLQIILKTPGSAPSNLTPIDKIEIHNIGSGQDAISYKQAINVITQAIILEIIKERGIVNILQDVTGLPPDLIRSLFPGMNDNVFDKTGDAIKGLFGQ